MLSMGVRCDVHGTEIYQPTSMYRIPWPLRTYGTRLPNARSRFHTEASVGSVYHRLELARHHYSCTPVKLSNDYGMCKANTHD